MNEEPSTVGQPQRSSIGVPTVFSLVGLLVGWTGAQYKSYRMRFGIVDVRVIFDKSGM